MQRDADSSKLHFAAFRQCKTIEAIRAVEGHTRQELGLYRPPPRLGSVLRRASFREQTSKTKSENRSLVDVRIIMSILASTGDSSAAINESD